MRIILSVTNDLVVEQRVNKVALSLQNAGADVLLLGMRQRKSPPVQRLYPTKRLRVFFTRGALFYAEFNLRLFIFLLFSRVNTLISNDLDTLPANFLIARLRSKKLVYDSHELFTEVPELVSRPRVQKFWLALERLMLPRIKRAYTVSQPIVDYYKEQYGLKMKLIRNMPLKKTEIIRRSLHLRANIILYQGALNVGRGIETTIRAMQFVENTEFWIIGGGTIEWQLHKLVQSLDLEKKVKFFGRLDFSQLFRYTVQAKIGLVVHEDYGKSYRYTLPNKLFDFIQAGVPVITSNMSEIQPIMEKYKIGLVAENFQPKQFAKLINEMLHDVSRQKIWAADLEKAAQIFCWEKQEEELLNLVMA